MTLLTARTRWTNPGDRIVFGTWQARSREYTAVPVSPEPWQQPRRCPSHDVTWRGTGHCWIGGTECTPVALW